MKCRFLYLVGELRPGGSERQLYYFLKSMDRERYRPELVVWNFRESDTYVPRIRALGVPIHGLSPASSRMKKLCMFRYLVNQINPEVIHSYSSYTNFATSWSAFGTRTIAIGGVRSDFDWAKKESGFLLGRLSGRWPRRQVFNSSAAAEATQAARGLFVPKHCVVVRNGLDLALFRNLPLAPNGKARILGVGSLFPVKRWDRLTAAALALKKRGLSFSIQVVGEGPLRESLNAEAQVLGVAEYIEFLGHADDIPSRLAEATFLVHPAEKEGCPNAVMEAMACGRAVVATDAGDVPHLIEEGKTGFVVRSDDEALLIERITTLIKDRSLCSRMGQAGRAKAELEFGLDRVVSETLDVYRAAGWKDA